MAELRYQSNSFNMRKTLWLLVFISLYTISCAQSRPPMNDTLSCPPNTMRIMGKIKKADKEFATITIVKVIAQGQGLVYALSEGEEVTVRLQEKSKISTGTTIEAYLKERIEIDASQSTYVLISILKK